MFNGDDMFGPIEGNSGGLEFESTEVFGPGFNNASPDNSIPSSNSSDGDITDEDKPLLWDLKSYSNENKVKKNWITSTLLLVGISV